MFLLSMHFVGLLLIFCFVPVENSGDFWFVTDFHVDQNYSRTGNPTDLCHESLTPYPDVGLYGNYLCDSPLSLVNVTIESMKSIQPKPDFIVWAGDNLPHTLKFDPDYEVVFEAIKNISESLSSAFPEVPIYPCIGNHDTFPPNILFPNATAQGVYEGYLIQGGWNKFLSKSAQVTFRQGGFFTEIIKPGLRVLSLNTIVWYTPNNYTMDLQDPEDQFNWLKQTLNKSSLLSEKVYIIGHVPPGYYNRGVPGEKSDPTFHPHFLEKYLDILHQYCDIIIGQMYGHIHMDMFQLFQFNTGVFKSSSILASSVTPWHYIDKYNVSLPVNPSIRLMHYDAIEFSLKDYDQFYLNLTKVNNLDKAASNKIDLYEHLYKFTEFYDVPDLSMKSLLQVYEMLKKNETIFKDFFKFLTAGKESVNCGKECKIAQLCAMSGTSVDEYNLCMISVNESSPISINTNTIITIIIILSLVILLASFVIFQKCRKSNFWRSRHETDYERFMSY